MLKYVTVACVLAALCAAAPASQNPQDEHFVSDVEPDGYSFADGTSRQEEDKLDNPQSENAEVTGSYSFVAPDGKHYTVTFTAGPNGYQPKTSLDQ